MTSEDKELILLLDSIELDLNKYKDMDRDTLFNYCIDRRLQATLLNYNEKVFIRYSRFYCRSGLSAFSVSTGRLFC